MEAKKCIEIFNRAIDDYHVSDHIDAKIINPFQQESFEAILYQKCWIDTVQWHMEDLISCLLYTSPSPRDGTSSRMPSSA